MIDTKNVVNSLSNIDEMPVFYPTEEEFVSPMDYIEKLFHEQNAGFFGTIKVVPPKSFKPTMAFDINSDQKLPTRY